MNLFQKKFLIITAHPDDLESGCGGLVARILEEGGTVKNLILVQPSAEQNKKRDKNIVEKELAHSNQILKVNTEIYNTPLHDNGRPNLTITNNLITYAESFMEDNNILISHWKEDHHQDHRACFDVAKSISRKHFEQFWCMDQTPYNLHYKNFNCNQYIDITDFVNVKKKALESYVSYYDEESIDRILNYNKYRGSFLGQGRVAETFQIMYNKNI